MKNQPAIQGTQVQSLGWEDHMEKGMATRSSTPAWRIPWTEEPGRRSQRAGMIEKLTLSHTHYTHGGKCSKKYHDAWQEILRITFSFVFHQLMGNILYLQNQNFICKASAVLKHGMSEIETYSTG